MFFFFFQVIEIWTTNLISQTPEFDWLVPWAAHKAVLVVQYQEIPDAACVTPETLQLNLFYVKSSVFIRSSNLVLPVGQPIAS